LDEEKPNQASPTPTSFTRDATGLVKQVSFLDSLGLNISNMSAGAALGTIGFTMIAVDVSGVNLFYGAIIAFVLAIPEIVVYTMMSRRMRRTGGDYVWVSRALGGFWGSSLSFMGYTLETLAFLALIVLSFVVAVGSVGVFLTDGSPSWLNLAVPGAAPLEQFAVGIVLFVLLIGLNVVKPRLGFKLVSGLTVVSVAILLIAILTLVANGHQGVVNYMNSVNASEAFVVPNVTAGNLTFSQVASTYQGSSFSFGPTLLILPFFAIFVFPWLNAAPAVASEIKGKSAIKWNIPISAAIVLVLIAGSFQAMYYAGGVPFINAALHNPDLVIYYSFNFWTLAMGVTSSVPLQYLIGLGWILWEVAVIAYGIIVFSRYIFAYAFDRFLPMRFANLNRFGSPLSAHMLDLIITIGLVAAFASFYGSLSALYAAVIAAMIYFFFVGVSAVIYANRHEKGNSKGTLSLAGALMSLVFLFIIYQFISNPTVWGTSATVAGIPGTDFAYAYAAGSFIAGAVLYMVSKSYYAKRGIDIGLAYKEIPPE
jgi:amino acid transporter